MSSRRETSDLGGRCREYFPPAWSIPNWPKMSGLDAERTARSGPGDCDKARVAWPSLRLYWVLFGVVLMVPEALSDLVFDVRPGRPLPLSTPGESLLSCSSERASGRGRGGKISPSGLDAAVLALLSASPLLSRATGDSRAWAALPWPGSPSHDNLPLGLPERHRCSARSSLRRP
jgi:hypothetical protein